MSAATGAGAAAAAADDGAETGVRSGYAAALREPGVARICAAGVLARLPVSMTPISVLLVARAHGGYAVGGLVAGIVGVSEAVSGPAWGRVADRRGARGVLLLTGAGSGLGLLALGPAVRASTVLAVVVAVVTGCLTPPVSGVVRARWAALPPEPRRVMQALESALTELVFVLGPVLVGLILAVASAGAALVAAAALASVGGIGLALAAAPAYPAYPAAAPAYPAAALAHPTEAAAPDGRRPARDLLGPLRLPALRLLCLVFFVQVAAFGAVEVGVTTLCANAGRAPLSGPLLGLWAAGSGVGGLLYGRRVRRGSPERQLLALTLATALLLALWLVSGDPVLLFAVAAPAGLAIAPGSQTVNGIVARVIPASQHNEAYGWLSQAAPALGGATGYAVAAAVAQATGPRVALLLAVVAALAAPVAVGARQSALR